MRSNFQDVKELRFNTDQNEEYEQSDKDTADVIDDTAEGGHDVGYVNKGFSDSGGSKEELSDKVSERRAAPAGTGSDRVGRALSR